MAECATCSGSLYPGCDACSAGFYLQPHNTHRCYMVCPTGYSPAAALCSGGNAVVLDFTFHTITPTVSGVNSAVALNGASITYYPPNFEASDPIPSKQRGYHFSGAQHIRLPPLAGTSGPSLVFTATFTFTAWIRPQGSGTRTIYSKRTTTDEIVSIRVSAGNAVEFVGGDPDTTYAHTSVLASDVWVFIGIQFSFDYTSGKTTMTFYYNGAQHATANLGNFIVKDINTSTAQVIGASSAMTNFFTGFIWRVKVSNYLSSDPTADIASPSCPVGPSFCLSPCAFNQAPDCTNCKASCTFGCVRTTDCSLCADELCDVCAEMLTNACTTCIPTALNTSPCSCPAHHYFNRPNRSCDPCPSECDTCSEAVYPGCLVCASGHYMQPMNANQCFPTCPTGYSASGAICTGADTVVLDFTFDQITPTLAGTNSVVALNGASNAYFPPNFESSDPLPSKHRGYYFSGSQYLQLPPLPGTSGSPLLLTTTLTFTAWIRPQGSGTIYSKKTASDEIFTIRVSSASTLEFVGGDPDVAYAHPYALASDTWVFVGVRFALNTGTHQTTMTFYYNSVLHATTHLANFVLNDSSLTAPQYLGVSGGLSDFFRGFIWRIKVSNFLSPDPTADYLSASCPVGPSFCLSPCPFSQAPDCSGCMGSCATGCVRTTDCSLCADELCNVCSEFVSTTCATCVTNAINVPPCSCAAHWYFSRASRSCNPCEPECDACSEAVYPGCDSCAPGWYMQPMNAHRCFPTCPSGYTPSGAACSGGDAVVMDFTFDRIMPTVAGVNSALAVNGATADYFPHTFEPSDPIPSKERGFYFQGSQYIQLPPLPGTGGDPLVFTTTLTFSTWVRPQGATTRTVYSKKEGSDEVFTVRINPSNSLELVGGDPDATYSHPQVLSDDTWVFVAIEFSFDVTAQATTLTFYYDSVQHPTTHTDTFCINDFSVTAPQYIGIATDLSDGFEGFIWRVTVSNYISNDATLGFVSLSCPAGASYCLSPCPFSQTPDCHDCLGVCPYGCVRATDCGLCTQELCEYCTDFFTSQCALCVPNALNSPPCSCQHSTFFSRLESRCQECAAECKECSGGSYSLCTECYDHAELRGSECLCADTHYPAPHSGQCKECPSSCKTCADASTCLSCKPHAHIDSSDCVCDEGFRGLPSSCQPCSVGCAECESYCIRCFPGYYNVGGFCSVHCPLHYVEDSQNWLCLYIPPVDLTATLNATGDSELFLSFSAQLKEDLQVGNFSLLLTDVDDVEAKYQLTMRSIKWHQDYFLELDIDLQNRTEFDAELFFLEAANIRDVNDNFLQTQNLSAVLRFPSPAYAASPMAPPLPCPAAQATVIASLSSSMMTGSPSLFFTLLNNLQLLSYLPLSGIQIPQQLRGLLLALSSSSFVPNPFKRVTDRGDPPPQFAESYGYKSCSFLANMGVMLSVGVVVIAASAASAILARCPRSFLSLYFRAVTKQQSWNPLLRYWIQVYLDAAVASFLQLYRVRTIAARLRLSISRV